MTRSVSHFYCSQLSTGPHESVDAVSAAFLSVASFQGFVFQLKYASPGKKHVVLTTL